MRCHYPDYYTLPERKKNHHRDYKPKEREGSGDIKIKINDVEMKTILKAIKRIKTQRQTNEIGNDIKY